MPQAANAVPGFLPSTNGLRFANRFASGPTVRLGPIDPRWVGVGDASSGLCGGMSWFVRDWFAAGLAIPSGTEAPPNGSRLFRALVRRQVLSLDWLRTPVRFWFAGAVGRSRAARHSLVAEWPLIRQDIDAGRLSMVGLVRRATVSPLDLTRNHQVLAYAYEIAANEVTLRIYDPNWPGRDDVTITLGRGGTIRQSTGEPLAGVLRLA
ncbi:MAG: hypothetical protein ACJ77I_11965 [Chloroflexota bacterium]